MVKAITKRIGTFVASYVLVVAAGPPAVLADAVAGDQSRSPAVHVAPEFADSQRVGRLVESLGSQRYITRREAEQQLLEIGMKAFDQIDAATDHPDPEIAASCRYLISELTVRWTRRDDPPQVKAALGDYANSDESQRLAVVQALGSRGDRWAIAPLCRICRYDPSPAVARQAAASLLRSRQLETGYTADDAAILRYEIGTSVRPPAQWIRLLAAQIDTPAAVTDVWWAAINAAAAEAALAVDDQRLAWQVEELLRNLARLELQKQNTSGFFQVLERLLQQPAVSMVDELERMLAWAEESGSPELGGELLVQYQPVLSETKAGLYLLAHSRARQGQSDIAEELAEEAFNTSGDSALGGESYSRVDAARTLMDDGHIEWARRELQQAIAEVPETSDLHSRAAMYLAQSLHDWQQHGKAAEVLAEFTSPLRSDPDLLKQYENRVRNSIRARDGESRLYTLEEIEAYQHYFAALDERSEGDNEGEWQSLERALKLDPTNADIIIAMYHASKENPERHAVAREAVHQRCRALEQSIDEFPYPAYYASNSYNEWAWLVSNTEGDFDKAVRYSRKSLDLFAERMAVDRVLEPKDSAGLLDTLARCYFAAGDIETAIEHQSQAVEYQPHLRVLQRQLDEFRQALTEKRR